MIEKLEGLSAEDRQLWEQKYQDRLKGRAPEEIERLWRDSRFVKKYRNNPGYKWMQALPAEERDRIYNQDYIKETNATNALNTPMTVDMGGKAVLTNHKVSPKNFSIESTAVASPNPDTKKLAQETLDVLNFTKDPATQKAIDDYQTAEQQYVKANPEYLSSEWYKRLAIKLAEEKSPVYKKYKNQEWFHLSDEQWGNALKKYEVDKTIYGEEDAAERLNNDMMKIASEQEPYYRKGALAFLGMGALVLGGLSVVGGMALATPEAVYNAAKNVIVDDQGIRFDQAFINTLISHPAVAYGTKVTLYGTLNTDRMKYIDEELGGLSDTGFAKDPEGGIFTENLPFELLQQYGSTALSMGLSAGASAAINGVVRGVAKASANKLSKKLAGDLLKKKLAESAIKYNTLNSVLQATTVPLFVAGFESGINGYQDKEQIFNELNLKNLEAYMAKVNSDVAEQELMLNLNRGAAEGQSFISDAERQLMQENAKRKYLPEYLQGEKHAEALAILAASSLFYTTSFVNGAANATLLRGLQAPKVQSALNNSKLFSKISKFMKPTTTASGAIGAAKVKTVIPTWLKVGAVLKQPAGEYLEEYLPAVEGMATADAKSYNMTLFLDKSYNSDVELEIGQAMEGLHEAFMRGVGEALVSKEANTQGVYGALSSVMGGPMMRMGDYRTSTVDRDGKMKTKFSLARREGEGKLEYATRLMPWQSGVTMEVRSQINQAKAAKKEAELLLLNLNDPELAARLKNAKTSMAWGKDMGDAAEAGDEFAYRNSEQGRAIQDAILLNKIKDTDLGKAHVSTMKRQALMEMNSPDAVQYIKEVKANPDNLSDGMTDELIVEQGKKNATRYLENLEFVSKETEVLNKQLGNVSDDVLSTLIYGRSQLQNWEKRAESLDKEITAVNILKPTVSSPVNADLTNVLKLFGSHKNMVAKKLALEKSILAREQSLKDYTKTHKKLTKPQLQAIDRYRLEIKSKKEELKAINALEKTVEGESLMNEHDILRAPADLRAHMLNPENKNSFTAAQLKVIEKVVEQGLAHSPEFLTKVQDAGKISEALGEYYSQYTKFLNNPGYLISYAERARLNKENAVFEKNAQKLANIDNYEIFASELDDIFNNPRNSKAVITKSTLDKISKDNPNHFYHKYKKDRTEFMGVLNSAIRSSNNEEMNEDDVAMLANAVKFLQANNIDLKDSSKIVEVMTAVDANGVNIFKDFMENQPKTSLLATKEGTYTSPEDIITKLKFVLDKYNKELEDLKSKDPKIVATETPASANITPVVPVVDVPKAPNNVTPGSNTELDDTPEGGDPQTPAEVSEAAKQTLRSGIETVEKTVKAAPKLYSQKAKDKISKDFSKITERLQDSPNATLETLMSEISKLQANYALLAANASDNDENTMYNHAGMLAQTIFTNLQALNSKQQNSIFDKLYFDYESVEQAQSPDAASIEVLNIAYLKRRFSNVGSPLVIYLNSYKVEEFLARNFKLFNPKGKTKIKFMYDPKLAKDVQSSMEAVGNKEYDLNAVPIVAVTLVREKTPTSIEVEEGGKTVYYQPIGILPSTTNPYAQGANRTKYLREQLPAKFEDLTTPTLLVDEKGNAIATTFSSKIHAKSPEKTNDRNIADVIVGQLNNTPENETLKSLNKKERLKSPLYKSIRDAFIKRFVSVKTDTTRLAFTQSNLNFGDENDIKYLYVIVTNGGDITKIEERNSDTKLVDLFLQENVDKKVAIDSNSRVEKFAFKLKLFIQKDFSKHTISVTVNSETGEVSAKDSAAEIKKLEESLTNSLNHVIFAKGSWTYTITPTDLVDANNNRLFNLSLTNQEGQDISIPLGQISKSELSLDSQFEIIQNIFKAAASQQAEFKFQVDYSDANTANSETATPEQKKIAFKNMQEMFDDGLFLINQTSTEFQITGFTMHSPYAKDGEQLKTNEVVTTPTVTDKTIISPNGEKVDSETMVADAKTTSTETKDAEVNKLLLEQQKHSLLFKLSDDGKYYINTKTGELFINLDYNEQDANEQDVRVNEILEAQKADIERRRQEELNNIGIKQKERAFSQLRDEKDKNGKVTKVKTPEEKLNAINLIERNVAEGAVLTKEQQKEVQKTKDELASQGYEVPKILGQNFHQGMKVIVTSAISDESLALGEEIITKVLTPQINKDGKMVQAAELEVTVGTKKGGLTREQWLEEQKKKETKTDKINAKYDAELAALEAQTTSNIKPGVTELFENDPELANKVYEALGFNTQKSDVNSETIEKLKDKIKALRNEDGTVPDAKINDFRNLRKQIQFLERDTLSNINRALQDFIDENKLSESDAKYFKKLATIRDNFQELVEDFNEAKGTNYTTTELMSFFNKEFNLQESIKNESKINKEKNQQYEKNILENNGFEANKDYTANELDEFVQKHGSNQVKFIWNLIKAAAQKLGVTTRFMLDGTHKIPASAAGHYFGGKIENKASLFSNPESAARIIVHELVHGVTTYILKAVEQNNTKVLSKLTNRQLKAVEKLNALFNELKKDKEFDDTYGTKNTHELLAELTNESFTDKLKAKNIFEKVLEAIFEIFNIPFNAYNESIKILEDLISNPIIENRYEGAQEESFSLYSQLTNQITQDNKSYYRGQIEKPTIDENGNLVLHAKEDELYKKAGLKSKGVSMTDDLQSAIEYGNGQLDVAMNLASETYDTDIELERLSTEGYWLIQIPKNISNEIVKEAGEVKVVGDKIIIPRGQYKIEQVVEGLESQITPEQKQEAQQLYSQYLEQNPNGDIEGFKEFIKGTQETTLAPKGTINVYWGQKESESSTRILSNLAPRKFTYEGREYGSVEHAYQSNKSGTFDKVTYDAYNSLKEIPNQQGKGWGKKIAPKVSVAQMKAADSLGLMKKLVVESFKQNPNSEAAKKLVQYENFTHNTNELIDKAFLEGLKLAQTELLNSKQVQSVKIVETTNIISLENTRIAALYDKINNLIKIDRQLLRQKYQEKAWTNPRKLIEILDGKQIESHVQPLPVDLFKSYEEWELFVINHEYQHSLYSRLDFNKSFPNKTKGDYESEINRRALQQLNLLNGSQNTLQAQKQNVKSETTQIDTKKLLLSLQMLGLNNLKKNFKISGQVLEGKHNFKVMSKADFVVTTPDGKIVVILDATKHVDNIEEKLNMQKALLEQNAKFKVATLYKADVNGKLTEVPILNSKEMAELSKNKIKQLNKSELINIKEEKSPSIVTKPVTVEDNLLLKASKDKLNTTKKEANTNNSAETLDDMVAGLDMFADLGIAEDLMGTPTSSISEFAWNNLKNLVLESGETVNEAEVKKMLESTGITELIWNNMTDQMRENTLRCKGFL